MADLGTIGVYSSGVAKATGSATPSTTLLFRQSEYFRVIPLYRTSLTMSEWGSLDATGQITGTVTVSGTPVPRCRVSCYWREGGTHVATVLTDTSGNYVFPYLDKTSSSYTVVAYDPPGGTQYNAKVYDYLTPV